MKPKVKCDIKKCVHNLGGTNCGAEQVQIDYTNYDSNHTATCNTYQSCYDGADNYVNNASSFNTTMSNTVDGVDMSPIAKCQVGNCKYNSNNGFCSATAISVSLNKTSECKTYSPK